MISPKKTQPKLLKKNTRISKTSKKSQATNEQDYQYYQDKQVEEVTNINEEMTNEQAESIRKVRDIKWYQKHVKNLRSKEQPQQRSVEWYNLRNTRITASEIASCLTNTEEICKAYMEEFNITDLKFDNKCLSHFDTREEYIIKKCKSFFGENVFKDSVFTLFGKKYEEIATRLYRIKFKTDVIEFGLLPHPRLKWVGASPDGITPDGVMLEIKCPYSRKINGRVPIHYWCQMMCQLEVADLDRCDFLECEIKELASEDEFLACENPEKGILLSVLGEAEKFIYPPDNLETPEEFLQWSQSINSNGQTKSNYWVINKWAVIEVNRRKDWFELVKPILKETHTFIRKLQEDPELFKKYEESIFLIKNKKYLDKYNKTTCLIGTEFDLDDDCIMEFDSDDEGTEATEESERCLI